MLHSKLALPVNNRIGREVLPGSNTSLLWKIVNYGQFFAALLPGQNFLPFLNFGLWDYKYVVVAFHATNCLVRLMQNF